MIKRTLLLAFLFLAIGVAPAAAQSAASVQTVVAAAAACPILGVAVVDPNNRSTWRIDFDPSCGAPAMAAGQAALLAYTVPADTCVLMLSGGSAVTYALPTATQQAEIGNVSLYTQIHANLFPGGTSSIVWPDSSGSPHTFASSADWIDFAIGIADCTAAYLGGQTNFAETIP